MQEKGWDGTLCEDLGGSQCSPQPSPLVVRVPQGGLSPKPFVHKVNGEEEAEAAEDGAENDGDDFTCVTPQRAQGGQGVSPTPQSCHGCALPVEYPPGPAREEAALRAPGAFVGSPASIPELSSYCW